MHLLGIIWLMKNIPFGDKQSEVRGIMIADENKYSYRGRTGYYSMIKDTNHKRFFILKMCTIISGMCIE